MAQDETQQIATGTEVAQPLSIDMKVVIAKVFVTFAIGIILGYSLSLVVSGHELTQFCGNGIKEGTERCDDGNTIDGDGCSSLCKRESGWACKGSPSTCTPICGDGIRSGSEQCDDGNTVESDGCSPSCTTETVVPAQFRMPAPVTGGAPVCGNGIKEAPEQCDDGNTKAGDGCSATCTLEGAHHYYGTFIGATSRTSSGGGGSRTAPEEETPTAPSTPGIALPPPIAIATCTDRFLNNGETDIDCGGPHCQPCTTNKICSVADDCTSNICTAGKCAAPTCTDTVLNQNETAVDCGGNVCSKCSDGNSCLVGTDCTSNACVGNMCVPTVCTDTVKNGFETDINCGGPLCGTCSNGKSCSIDLDCASTYCDPATKFCAPKPCTLNVNCPAGNYCVASTNTCGPGSCTDGYLNNGETDIDCGGLNCAKCGLGKNCLFDDDCTATLICNSMTKTCNTLTATLTATASASSPSGTAPLLETFTATASGGTSPYTYSWDFKDGTTGTGASVSHTYSTAGAYTATVTVTDFSSPVKTTAATASVSATAPAPTASCTDAIKNQDETDVDCGGSTCPNKCANTNLCSADTDCRSGYCDLTTTTCQNPPISIPFCGDGTREAPEECDGADFPNGDSCTTIPGYSSGTLLCGSNCYIDPSQCKATVQCIDSDGGANYAMVGHITMNALGGLTLYDVCQDTYLKERVCNSPTDYNANTDLHSCPYGCTSGACNPAPGSTTLSATAISNSQISVGWTDTSSTETGFKLERCQGAGCISFTQIATPGANVVSYSDTRLTAGTTYCYRVRSTYAAAADSDYSSTGCAMTTAPLSISASVSPTSGIATVTTFSFSSTPAGGTSPYTYSWNFGDGTSLSTAQNPPHTYTTAGSYTAAVTVTDFSSPAQSVSSTPLTITVAATLTATASASSPSGTAPLLETFTATASGGTSPYTYAWNFNDGTTGTGATISHTYNTANSYTATVTVTDSSSPVKTTTASASVSATACTPSCPLASSVTCGQTITPTNACGTCAGTGTLCSSGYTCSSGTCTLTPPVAPSNLMVIGTPSTSVSLSWTDNSNNEAYFVISRCTGSGCTFSTTLQLGSVGANVNSYTDSYSLLASTTYGYRVLAHNTAGDSLFSNIVYATMPAAPLTATAVASSPSGTVPLAETFTATASGGISPYTYAWDFKDGTTGTGASVSHTYSTAGSYTATVTVTDSSSPVKTTTASASVSATACTVSSYNPALNTFCGTQSVTTNCGTTVSQTGTLTCTSPQTCGGGGTPNACGCAAITSCAGYAECGSISNGCGGTLTCPSCSAGYSCSAGKCYDTTPPTVSGVSPTTATAGVAVTLSATYSDSGGIRGCNLYIDGADTGTMSLTGSTSGTASKSYTFSTSGAYNAQVKCTDGALNLGSGTSTSISVASGCTPTTCAAQGKNCGSIPNGCGGSVSCGTCPTTQATQTCSSNVCVPPTSAPYEYTTMYSTACTSSVVSGTWDGVFSKCVSNVYVILPSSSMYSTTCTSSVVSGTWDGVYSKCWYRASTTLYEYTTMYSTTCTSSVVSGTWDGVYSKCWSRNSLRSTSSISPSTCTSATYNGVWDGVYSKCWYP